MAITVGQSTGRDVTVAASTFTLNSSGLQLTAGDAIVVCVTGFDGTQPSTVYDNTANVYKLAYSTTQNAPVSAACAIWYATNISSASTLISATISGGLSTIGSISALVVQGMSTGSPLHGTASSLSGANSGASCSNFTPSTQGIGIGCFYFNGSIGNMTTGASYTPFPSSGFATRTFEQYWNQSSPTATDSTMLTSGTPKHLGVFAYFADTVAAGAAAYYAPPVFLQMGLQH